MMNRHQKEAVVAELHEKFCGSNAVFLINYKGLTVSQLEGLKKRLRSSNASMKVAKARLMKIAARDTKLEKELSGNFKDQVGLVFANNEVPAVAKDIVEFAKENEALKVIAGFYESGFLSQQQVKYLASLPSREVLLAQLVGTLQAPMVMLLLTLKSLLEKKEGASNEIEKSQEPSSSGDRES